MSYKKQFLFSNGIEARKYNYLKYLKILNYANDTKTHARFKKLNPPS